MAGRNDGVNAARARSLLLQADVHKPVTVVPPTLAGTHGTAWLCDLDAGRKKLGATADKDALLVHWLVEAPWAHPAIHSYSIIVMHMRPVPGKKDSVAFLPGATHEMLLFSVQPFHDREKMIVDGVVARAWIPPPNFAAQFIEPDDAAALARVKAAVDLILTGQLNPAGQPGPWADLFGDNMLRKAAAEISVAAKP